MSGLSFRCYLETSSVVYVIDDVSRMLTIFYVRNQPSNENILAAEQSLSRIRSDLTERRAQIRLREVMHSSLVILLQAEPCAVSHSPSLKGIGSPA
jgi:hypothetical protein